MTDRRLYTILTIAGAAPFVAAALLPPLGFETLGPLGSAVDLALSYGLAIVCFLAGTHWATFLHRRDRAPTNLFVASNVVVLGVWIPYLLAPVRWSSMALTFGLLYLLYIDFRLRRTGTVDAHYVRVRSIATALAVGSLAVVAATA